MDTLISRGEWNIAPLMKRGLLSADAVDPATQRLRDMIERHGVRVVARIAENPDAPAALVGQVARHRLLSGGSDEDERITTAIVRHPSLPVSVMVEIFEVCAPGD